MNILTSFICNISGFVIFILLNFVSKFSSIDLDITLLCSRSLSISILHTFTNVFPSKVLPCIGKASSALIVLANLPKDNEESL